MKTATITAAAGLLLAGTVHAQSSSACGDISNFISKQNLTTPKAVRISAGTAIQCLRSVPIDHTAASKWVKSYNASFLQFQSTSAYLKDPPSSYQQPAVDLQAGISRIQENLDAGRYGNEYDFEADFYRLTQSAHDGHFSVLSGALDAFLFSVPYPLISLSSDGHMVPEVFAYTDLVGSSNETRDWTASSLQNINGQDAVAYLKDFAANYSSGGLEAHVDWNALMVSAAGVVTQNDGAFGGFPVFTGEWFNATFANGTRSNQPFIANIRPTAVSAFANITSGQDFYEAFVALPDEDGSTSTASAPATSTAAATATTTAVASTTAQALPRWTVAAYPKPFIVQDGLGVPRGEVDPSQGWVTGYMLQDASLAVLSIPSFSMTGIDAQSFSSVVENFLSQTKQAGIKHILIDVQANGGGDALLSTELYKQFFPSKYPFGGSRLRIHDSANVIGETFSNYLESNKDNETLVMQAEGSAWVAQNYIDAATGNHFTSWDQVSNGYSQKGDNYSVTQVDDLSNADQDRTSTGDGNSGPGIVIYGYGNRTNVSSQPYDAQDIAILSDGYCASTCTTFIELFHHQAGVRVVAAGGTPDAGPMQGAGGVRGAQSYEIGNLNGDVQQAYAIDSATIETLRPIVDTGIQLVSGGFNLRDQVRENQTFPLQFEYAPADCRIYYTPETYDNYTALWMTAANAIWSDSGLCVDGSTGKANANGTTSTGGSDTGSSPGASPTTSPGPNTAGAASLKMGWAAMALPVLAVLLM